MREFGTLVLSLARDRQPWAFAYFGVPAVVIGLVFLVGGGSALLDLEPPISVARLQTRVDVFGPAEQSGLAIIIEPVARTRFVLPWHSPDPQVWSSLDPSLQRANHDAVRVMDGQIDVALPLVGSSEPVVLVVTGEPAGDILLLGRRMPLDALRLAGRQSAAMALWVFVAAIFAALLLGTWPRQERS